MAALSPEKQTAPVLIVDGNDKDRFALWAALKACGFEQVTEANTYEAALDQLGSRKCTYLFLTLEKGKIAPVTFLARALKTDPRISIITVSAECNLSELFSVFQNGAKAHLMKPVAAPENVQEVIEIAEKGWPLPPGIITDLEALTQYLMEQLNRLVRARKEIEEDQHLVRFLPLYIGSFVSAAQQSKKLRTENRLLWLESIEKVLLKDASETTRLGKLRRQLAEKRMRARGTPT